MEKGGNAKTATVESTSSVDKLGGARQEPEQEEAIVHHALVGAVNSKANLANSQDGGARESEGDHAMWEIMLPWIKDHGASWNWFKVYYASFAAYNNGDFERSSMLKKDAGAVQRALQMTWSASWIPGASAFVCCRIAAIKAAVADLDSAADGHATHAAKVKPDQTGQLGIVLVVREASRRIGNQSIQQWQVHWKCPPMRNVNDD
jgi:hypothetical protein